jgi:hypothetical protein
MALYWGSFAVLVLSGISRDIYMGGDHSVGSKVLALVLLPTLLLFIGVACLPARMVALDSQLTRPIRMLGLLSGLLLLIFCSSLELFIAWQNGFEGEMRRLIGFLIGTFGQSVIVAVEMRGLSRS